VKEGFLEFLVCEGVEGRGEDQLGYQGEIVGEVGSEEKGEE
jgi:hypothetical protein